MRKFIATPLGWVPFVVLAASAFAGDLSFKRVWVDYRPEDKFERLGEYLTGAEKPLDGALLRTEAKSRAGQYWLVRVKNSGQAQTARVELQVIGSDSPQVVTFDHFPTLTLSAGEQVLNIGLTHGAWSQEVQRPVAWQLRLIDESGRELARQASFLW